MHTPSAMFSKSLLLSALTASFFLYAADEPVELSSATNEDVSQIKEVCLELITEQEVPLEEQDHFLLTCVNDQLFEMGYLAVTQADLK